MNLTRAEVSKALARHYSRKFNGIVRSDWDSHKRAYFIQGDNLPPHPEMVKHYPNGWNLLDYITPVIAKQIIIGDTE